MSRVQVIKIRNLTLNRLLILEFEKKMGYLIVSVRDKWVNYIYIVMSLGITRQKHSNKTLNVFRARLSTLAVRAEGSSQ